MTRRLVTFVGTGSYTHTRYQWPGFGECATPYVAEALATMWQPQEVVLLATEAARQQHGERLQARLAPIAGTPQWRIQPEGPTDEAQWAQFELLAGCLECRAGDEVLLDITHSFRAHPFMAGAAVAVLRAAGRQSGDASIVYGEFRRDAGSSPIWDLTRFVQLVDWAQALGLFLHTGVAGPLTALARGEQRELSEQARAGSGRNFPGFGRLVGAIERFAGDLATIRVASIVTGYEQEDPKKSKARSSARAVLDAIEACRDEITQRLPPLAMILDRLAADVGPLAAERLFGPDGERALGALAEYYLRLGRCPEAAAVVREGYVNRHASSPEAVEVNSPTFDDGSRQDAEARFSSEDPHHREIADPRNDIEHGGFRRQPLGAGALGERIQAVARRFLEEIGADSLPWPEPSGRTLFVSRHPGATEWAEQEGLRVDEVHAHLDLASVQRGDTVIGNLPVPLIAEVNRRGARYLHLTFDAPSASRGQELSAAQLRALGARVEPYTARRG